MRNFMEAYAAVHSSEAKEEFYSQRDPVSDMNTATLTDNDLREISEEICETLFAGGLGVQEAADILSDVLAEGENSGRNAKLSRLFDAFAETFNRIQSKANELEEFAKYRNNKRLQETWSARFNQEKRIKRHHNALVAEDVAGVKAGILQMVEGYKPLPKEKMARQASKAYGKEQRAVAAGDEKETNKQMQRRIAMQNPAGRKAQLAKEESEIEEGNMKAARANVGAKTCWDGYKAKGTKTKNGKTVPNCVKEEEIEEGSRPKAGKDYDGDGKVESSSKEHAGVVHNAIQRKKGGTPNGQDTRKEEVEISEGGRPTLGQIWADRRNKAHREAGYANDQVKWEKKKKEVKEGIDPKGAARIDAAKKKKKVDVFAYDRKIGKKTLPDGRPLPPAPKNESVKFSEAELKAFEEIVNSWED